MHLFWRIIIKVLRILICKLPTCIEIFCIFNYIISDLSGGVHHPLLDHLKHAADISTSPIHHPEKEPEKSKQSDEKNLRLVLSASTPVIR